MKERGAGKIRDQRLVERLPARRVAQGAQGEPPRVPGRRGERRRARRATPGPESRITQIADRPKLWTRRRRWCRARPLRLVPAGSAPLSFARGVHPCKMVPRHERERLPHASPGARRAIAVLSVYAAAPLPPRCLAFAPPRVGPPPAAVARTARGGAVSCWSPWQPRTVAGRSFAFHHASMAGASVAGLESGSSRPRSPRAIGEPGPPAVGASARGGGLIVDRKFSPRIVLWFAMPPARPPAEAPDPRQSSRPLGGEHPGLGHAAMSRAFRPLPPRARPPPPVSGYRAPTAPAAPQRSAPAAKQGATTCSAFGPPPRLPPSLAAASSLRRSSSAHPPPVRGGARVGLPAFRCKP